MLLVVDGPDSGVRVEVTGSRATVGRSAVHDLSLTDSSVSQAHFEIELTPAGLLLRDMGSSNGTSVNDVRVQEAWVEPGAVVRAGRTAVRVLSADEITVLLSESETFGEMRGGSVAMRELFAELGKLAASDVKVLLHGETGTGKELAARAVHDHSSRREGPFVVLDCGTLPRELAESEIFGHKKGAFTGATADRAGRFEEAHGGTLFIDEIGELPIDLQPKLLRAVERSEVQRVGENEVRKLNVRLVSATHRDLRKLASAKEFREDLYFRVAMAVVEIPPLRARGDDIVLLAETFIEQVASAANKRVLLGDDAKACLQRHSWPGNVRELRNAVECATYLAEGGTIGADDARMGLQDVGPAGRDTSETLGADQVEGLFSLPLKEAELQFKREYLRRVLERAGWNNAEAAKAIGYSREGVRTLRDKLRLAPE